MKLDASLATLFSGLEPSDSPAPPAPLGPSGLPRVLAAALLLLFPHQGQAHFVLTQRASQLPAHPGQVALPGGALEPGETPLQAALREAGEEVGLRPGRLRVMGRLRPVEIAVTNFLLLPYLAWSPVRPRLRASPHEVERLLEVPLAELLDPASTGDEVWELAGDRYRVAFFRLQGVQVWGATARVLSQVRDALAEPLPPDRMVPGAVLPAAGSGPAG